MDLYIIKNKLQIKGEYVETMSKKNRKKIDMQSLTFITILLVFIGLGGFVLFQSFLSDSGEEKQRVNVDIQNQPAIGDANAPVKVVEFGDFKCPSCKNFQELIYPLLKKEYIDTGKVQLVFRNFQFLGEDSITAAMIGKSIYTQNPEAFWKYYELIYRHQKDEGTVWATPEYILPLVKKNIPEIDINKTSEEVKNKKYKTEVEKDNEYARSLQLSGVPAVFVNGMPIDNPLDYRELKNVIEKELEKK